MDTDTRWTLRALFGFFVAIVVYAGGDLINRGEHSRLLHEWDVVVLVGYALVILLGVGGAWRCWYELHDLDRATFWLLLPLLFTAAGSCLAVSLFAAKAA